MPICIREYGYLLDGVDKGNHANAVGIPKSAYKSLLSLLHDETADQELGSFIKLTSFKRQPALKVQNYVGVLQTPCGTQIEILPKLYNKQACETSIEATRAKLITMLRALRDSPFKDAGKAEIRDAKMPLLEVYISQFLGLVNQLVKRGIRSDYVVVQKNTLFLKGRLRLSQQIRQNAFHPEKFCIEYQEYVVNRPANRLIKSTLALVNKIARTPQNQRLGRELSFVFADVPDSQDYKLDFQMMKTDRSMGHYKETMPWCRLLLGGNGPTASAGNFNTLTLLYPMERIFEDYVAHCLRRKLTDYYPVGHKLKTQTRKHSLVEEHQGKPIFNLRPDLMIQNEGVNICVMDTKWKLIDSTERSNKYGISQSDMYQIYAYGHKYLKGKEQKKLMLIYPKTDTFFEPLPAFNYEDGFTLDVVPFDLDRGELIFSKVITSKYIEGSLI